MKNRSRGAHKTHSELLKSYSYVLRWDEQVHEELARQDAYIAALEAALEKILEGKGIRRACEDARKLLEKRHEICSLHRE